MIRACGKNLDLGFEGFASLDGGTDGLGGEVGRLIGKELYIHGLNACVCIYTSVFNLSLL